MTFPPDDPTLPFGPDAIRAAASVILDGGIVAVPTETVYGLAADATDAKGVARIYAAKGRPSFNPLIVHVPDLAAAQALADFDEDALALAHAFWPGPLTLVRPLKRGGHRVAGHGGTGYGRDPRTAPPRDAGAADARRSPARRTIGQCQRRDQPDPRRPCPRQPGPRRAGHRRRCDRGGPGIDHRRGSHHPAPRPGDGGDAGAGAGRCGAGPRGPAIVTAPGNSPAITRRANPCG